MRKAKYEFSVGLRLAHWIRAFAIVLLIFSGYYISYVFIAPNISSEPTLFLQAKFRMTHQVFGFVLIGCLIFKCYLFVFDKHSRKELKSVFDFLDPKVWIAQIKYYIFIGEHPHLRGVYNPLQFGAYLLFYGILVIICVTGLVLYANVYHQGLGGSIYGLARQLEELMGGLANVRTIHRICMWVIMIFVPIHVYMAIFNAVKGKDGAMDAIISGYKFVKKEH